MGHKKLIRFEEITRFPNVLIFPEDMAGRWSSQFGQPVEELTLELACGKGEYTLGLARMHPNRFFVGVDIKGNRIWKGARTALDEQLTRVAFLRTQIDHIDRYFAPGSIREIWITFPDPFLRTSKASRRLTHLRFLALYQRILKPGGAIHLKTDSAELYAFTKEVIRETGCELELDLPDIYAGSSRNPELDIRTYYEGMHLQEGRTIRYLKFRLPVTLPVWTRKSHTVQKSELPEESAGSSASKPTRASAMPEK